MMNRPLRVTAWVLVLGLTIALTGFVVVPWLGGPALFAVDGQAPGHEMWQEQRRGEALDKRHAAVGRCLAGKAEVTEEVVAGRLSLAEAIDRFRQLEALRDEGPDEAPGTPSRLAADGDEKIAQNVLSWASWRLYKEPSRRAEVMTRLEKELAEWQARRER
jgi:hypothetical protein